MKKLAQIIVITMGLSSAVAIANPNQQSKPAAKAPPPEIYVSTDIEADGPIPGPHSMLSFGSAAFTAEGELISTFTANLHLLEGASGHPDTMAWWAENEAAWEESRRDLQKPEEAIAKYIEWIEELPGRPIFVAYPAGFDFMFVQWYLVNFADEKPFGHSALDIGSYAMAVMRVPYRQASKSRMPEHWIPETRHTHVALEDAIEQGQIFCNILAEQRR